MQNIINMLYLQTITIAMITGKSGHDTYASVTTDSEDK